MILCEAQNPKSKRFYQQLEPTTKQNHTVTRSVVRSGKLGEQDTMQIRNHNVSSQDSTFSPHTAKHESGVVATFATYVKFIQVPS